MIHKIRYSGRRTDGHIKFANYSAEDAIKNGYRFDDKGYDMQVSDSDKLKFLMHRHCPHLQLKINSEYKYTIAEMYELCPAALLDLLELNGGEDYIAHILLMYEELYAQEQIKKEWLENQ